MVFSSTLFLFLFLPFTIGIYFIMPKAFRNSFLLLASLAFLAMGSVYSTAIMLCSITVNFFCGLGMHKWKHTSAIKNFFFIVALLGNLGLLFYFKYGNLITHGINTVFKTTWVSEIFLPIGISFFIFQGLSYIIDLYRGQVEVQKNPLHLALYIALFPQLIAGPIVRYSQVEYELKHRTHSTENVYIGLQRFIIGLSKKMLLANPVAAVVDHVFANPDEQSHAVLLFAILCYALQIYFDFSGYSDMAIGLGRVFGFHFNENFNLPYISSSLSEFWKRWHISLSSWFRDYLYIPLGGNRKGNQYVNLLIVFVATGIWHGAHLVYLFWGLWHGLFLMIEHYLKKKGKLQNKGFSPLGFIYTLFVVLVGWVPFRAGGLASFKAFIQAFLHANSGYIRFDLSYYCNAYIGLLFIVGWLIAWGLPQKYFQKLPTKFQSGFKNYVQPYLLLLCLVLCIIYLVNGTFNPFIYFQF